jgi:hypothetical protein
LQPGLRRINDEPRIGFSDRIFLNPGCQIIGFGFCQSSDRIFGSDFSKSRMSDYRIRILPIFGSDFRIGFLKISDVGLSDFRMKKSRISVLRIRIFGYPTQPCLQHESEKFCIDQLCQKFDSPLLMRNPNTIVANLVWNAKLRKEPISLWIFKMV